SVSLRGEAGQVVTCSNANAYKRRHKLSFPVHYQRFKISYCPPAFLFQLPSCRVMQGLPSPAESPSLKPKVPSPQTSSRKRQRSQSMQSDTSSSSAKRSQSGGPSND